MKVTDLKSAKTGSIAAARAAQVQMVLDELLRLDWAAWPDDSALAAHYPELMPELGEQLRVLRTIRTAVAKAMSPKSGADAADLLDAICVDDLRFLQAELSDYDVLERVQYGGQGVVYKAVQRATKRTVAVKVLLDGPLATPRQRQRFEREVELCSRLQHPNIVTLYDSGVIRGRNYCAMEFVEGLPIDEYVLLHASPAAEIVRLFVTVSRAISYAHQRGVIHRDLSPANIMVDLDGEPHVLDFGLAKDAWTDGQDGPLISSPGQVVGTLPYLSPEHVGGLDGQVDVRSDIYSLGVVLYQLLSGRLPYPEVASPAALRDQILNGEPMLLRTAARRQQADAPQPLPDLTRDLEMILCVALAKDKESRYQTAADLADDLERHLAGDAVEARGHNRLYLLRKVMKKHRLAFGVAAAFLLALGLGSVAITTLWIEAAAQRDNAREAVRVAHAMFDKVVTEVDGAIRPLAGGIEVRDRLLGSMAAELPALERLVASDAKLVNVLEKLHERQGDIDAAQGRRLEAAQQYRTFLDIALRQKDGQPDSLENLGDLVRAHRKLAAVAADPLEHYQRAIELAQLLVSRKPDKVEFKYALCQTQIEFGRCLFQEGAYTRAAEQIDAGIALADSLGSVNTDDDEWAALMALAQERASEVRFKLGDGSQAIAALEECLRLRQRLSAAHPADVDCRHKVLRACLRLGSAYRDAGRPDAARQLFEQAVTAGEYLTLVDHSVTDWKHDLIVAHEGLALLFAGAGDVEQAAPHCETMLALAKQLSQSDPRNADWANSLAAAHMQRANLSLARNDFAAAQADYEAAVSIRKDVCARDPQNRARQSDLANAHDWLGMCYRKLGRTADAKASYEQAHQLRQALRRAEPNVFKWQVDVILSQTKLATWHLDQNTPEDDAVAAAFLQQAERALLALEASGKLAGQEGRYAAWLPAIRRNQALIAERARQRTATQPAVYQVSGPASAPSRR